MEELSKSQIVLLTLLVSFVTSIATGIVTVSLMEQAPPTIAQTVNRVIERTVEKVVPSPSGQAAAATVTTEKTVVVKESDLIVQAVEKATPSLVRVYTSSAKEPIFLGLGVVLDSEGSIIVDAATLADVNDTAVTFSDGSSLMARVASRDETTGIATLKVATTTTADGKTEHFTPASLSTVHPVLGETIVVLSGKAIPRITDGLVTALIPRDEEDAIIDTNIPTDFVMGGSPLINTEGALLGVSTSVSRASSQGGFIPSSALVKKSPSEKSGSPASE